MSGCSKKDDTGEGKRETEKETILLELRDTEESNDTTEANHSKEEEESAENILNDKTDEILHYDFVLKNLQGREQNITLDNGQLTFEGIDKPLILINFFATWCHPCRAELPYLSQLKTKYRKELTVIGVLVNDEQNSTEFGKFLKKYGVKYFVSLTKENDLLAEQIVKSLGLPENYSIPLSILYKNGKLYRYYEGAMPMKMLDNEIRQARKER